MVIQIDVTDKHATVVGAPVIVCGNSTYSVQFTFDDEWAAETEKVARFVWVYGGKVVHHDVELVDNTCQVPALSNVAEVRVGAYAGNLITSTPAIISCERSILCGSGEAALSGDGGSVPIMSETVAGIAKVGDNLKIDSEGRLSVDTTDEVEGDNTRPVTAAAVHTTVGNIETLLETV